MKNKRENKNEENRKKTPVKKILSSKKKKNDDNDDFEEEHDNEVNEFSDNKPLNKKVSFSLIEELKEGENTLKFAGCFIEKEYADELETILKQKGHTTSLKYLKGDSGFAVYSIKKMEQGGTATGLAAENSPSAANSGHGSFQPIPAAPVEETKEQLVLKHMYMGEISLVHFSTILGRAPKFQEQVGNLLMQKCFLKEAYKKMN